MSTMTNYSKHTLNIYGGIIFGLLLVMLIWLIVLTVIIADENKQITTLYINNGANNTMKASSASKILYTYHTRNNNSILQSYSGKFLVTYSPIGSVNFTVTNQYGKNVTSNISNPKHVNLPTEVSFNSTEITDILTLNYSSNDDFDLERLEILI
jgi:hypothetical protein